MTQHGQKRHISAAFRISTHLVCVLKFRKTIQTVSERCKSRHLLWECNCISVQGSESLLLEFWETHAAIMVTSFPRRAVVISAGQCLMSFCLHDFRQHGFRDAEFVLDWPVCSTGLFPVRNIYLYTFYWVTEQWEIETDSSRKTATVMVVFSIVSD